MELLINVLCIIVALEHFYFLILEMFLWTKPFGRKVFHNTEDYSRSTKVLAANQGLYNGFLAAGLIWSFFISDVSFATDVKIFFLSCVLIAGIYGGYSVSKRLFIIQGIPAGLTLILLFLK